MKKILALMLAALMLLSFVACGGNNDTESDAPENTETETETEAPVVEEGIIVPNVDTNTWGYALWSAFLASAKANPEAAAIDHVDAILASDAGKVLGARVETMELTADAYVPGFSENITGFKQAAVYTPTSTGFAFMSHVFVLEDESGVNAFMQQLDDKKDMRFMICMTAEAFTVGAYKNLVFCALSPEAMPGVGPVDAEIIDADVTEGTVAADLWDFFCQAMLENPTANAEEMGYAIAYSPVIPFDLCDVNFVTAGEVKDFAYAIDGGFESATCVTPQGVESGFAIYIFSLEAGLNVENWMNYYAASAKGEQVAYGAYNNNVIVMINTEVAE